MEHKQACYLTPDDPFHRAQQPLNSYHSGIFVEDYSEVSPGGG